MQIYIVAVGRLKSGPERTLIDDYVTRFTRTGRGLGFTSLEIREVEAKKGGQTEEAQLLARALPAKGVICALDERGRVESSPDFAARLGQWRDEGHGAISFIIGGADGIEPELRSRAQHKLSFGQMVWPHMLARVMLTEQLYRAATILAGGPYHRA
ncbi:MAG: 23S rRNA (pseudouridine(1915)-N(3))-methyltransferase RlmH [Mangrovicoccus sp.]